MSETGNRTVIVDSASLDIDRFPALGLCSNGNLDIEYEQRRVDADLSSVGFVTVSQAAAIAQAMKDRAKRDLPGRLAHPSGDAKRYLERMNFYRFLGIKTDEDFVRHDPADRFIPMEALEDESAPSGLSDRLRDMVRRHAPNVHESVLGSLHMAFGEIMDNAVQHSDTPTPGIATAQYYPSRRYIELCVVDGGKGVVASLRENPDYSAYGDSELAAMAFEQEVGQYVGRPDFANNRVSMGRGLFIASRIVRAMGGYLWMASRNTFAEVSCGGVKVGGGCFFPGTLVVARMPVHSGLIVRGSDISDELAASPISWSAEEGGFYYTDGNEETMLW